MPPVYSLSKQWLLLLLSTADAVIFQTQYFRPHSWVSNGHEPWHDDVKPSPPDTTLNILSRMGMKMRPSHDHTVMVNIPIKKRTVLRVNMILHYYVTLNNIAILLKRDNQREWKMRQSHKAGLYSYLFLFYLGTQ